MKNNNIWYRLDTAALIFPSTMRDNWSNAFRVSVTLKDEIDKDILEVAINNMRKRFPSFFVTLETGFFWYYLKRSDNRIIPTKEYAYPLTFMSRHMLKKSCIRVLYYENRIAVEFFHSITDGSGGIIFLKNLAKEYLELKYKIKIDCFNDLYDLNKEPSEEELSDGFFKNTGKYPCSRKETNSYKLHGHRLDKKTNALITGIIDTDKLLYLAHKYGCTVTSFLGSVIVECLIRMQEVETKEFRQKDCKVTIPINMRKTFNFHTMRNFVLTLNLGVDPKLGKWSLEDICKQVTCQLKAESVPLKMASRVAANVLPQQNILIRMVPLFLKNLIMRMVYNDSGERKGSINCSNLGLIEVPDNMMDYIERFEFIIGPQLSYPNNMGVVSFNGKTYINFIRKIEETNLERLFFSRLVELGLDVEIESLEVDE